MASIERQRDIRGRFITINLEETFSELSLSDLSPDRHNLPVRTMAFHLNPYDGDINPTVGEGLKLFLKATEERNNGSKLKIAQSNVQTIMDAFSSDARKFGWSPLVNNVPTTAAGNNKSILTNFTEVSLEHVKKQARTT